MIKTIDLPPILIKVGREEHLRDLVNNGKILFGSSRFYRGQDKPDYKTTLERVIYNQIDENLSTFDPLESASSIEYTNEGPIVNFSESHSHILSLYGFAPKVDFNFKISDKMREFGYKFFTIFDSKFFLEKLNLALGEINLTNVVSQPEYGYVKYYDLKPGENISNLTQFHKKKSDFDYQMEYRVIARLPQNESLNGGCIVNLGCPLFKDSEWDDKAEVYPIEKLYSMLLDIRGE
ncbi:hypothetical protein [Sphingobacterium sp. UGAL515B_05]|uniref:hypothetical protein n=1 Tax=Sphingobacterium sp. UGAL515B_05 TaxID=2986767 RepID=UPI0029535D22|nr:hypothetical protein [Sphingobacterium sp. UGAL515B_05]WON94776.1 hypothetical protein OK025_26515 [Sphingobacterium sp. UGAL515B_05]